MRGLEQKGLYRAKEYCHDEWRFGYFYNTILPYIVAQDDNHPEKLVKYMVKGDTVGEFSGVYDCNNEMIFENDIVETNIYYANLRVKGICEFRDGSFGVVWKRGEVETFTPFSAFANCEFKVIGNVFDYER